MKFMKKLIGVTLVLLGIAAGLYVGGYLLFVGGIVQVIHAIVAASRGQELDAVMVATGILKFMVSGMVGLLICLFCSFIGGTCLRD